VTFRDILTNILVTADYPEVKRQGFINTFYEYLLVRILEELEQHDTELYTKMVGYFDSEDAVSSDVHKGLQEAYQNPQLKAKIDKAVDEVATELAKDISKYSPDSQKKNIVAGIAQS